jgi:D-3-phosphoglycerate dehydrogenase
MQGSTLGIFGAGNIGLRVAKMAKAIGLNVLVCDPVFKTSEENPFAVVSFDELLSKADFITIHSPLLDSTKHKFDLNAFKKMKKGALIVNAARGGIIKEADLLQALKEGILGGAALDVFENEPFDVADPVVAELLKHERFVATPHVGAQTAESQKAVGLETAEKILAVHSVLGGATGVAPKALNQPKNPRWALKF